jgi:hypothetical protein
LATSTAPEDLFREVLQQYIAAAPSGFISLGATPGGGDGWTPTVMLPGSTHCLSLAFSDLSLVCMLFSSRNLAAADVKWTEISFKVQAALPGQGWQREETGDTL